MLSQLLALAAAAAPALCWAGNSNTSTLVASDFSSSSLSPFVECTYESPSYAAPVDGRLKVFFDEANYDGTRDTRGVEICTTIDPVLKELWQGFDLWVPSATYPDGKQSIIAQQFCLGYCASWCGTLSIINYTLVVDHRNTCGTPTEVVVVDNIVLDEWHPVVVNARFSNSLDGHYVVWWDGNVVYNASDINLGFDSAWNSNGTMTTGVGFKNGQYDAGKSIVQLHYTSATPSGWLSGTDGICVLSDTALYTGVNRTLYFDNVSWYNVDAGQTDGYAVVNPGTGS